MCLISSFETRSSPDSLAATLAALPSISEIPFPRLKLARRPIRSVAAATFTFYFENPISSVPDFLIS